MSLGQKRSVFLSVSAQSAFMVFLCTLLFKDKKLTR
jgi:hypothetical protein